MILLKEEVIHVHNPYIITWNITNLCNLKCRYCNLDYRNTNSDMTFDEVKSVIDKLASEKVFMISFGGGEPLYRENFIDIIEYCKNKNINTLIATNGYKIDFKMVQTLENMGVSAIAVTLDSYDKEVNDYHRGTGSYDAAINAIKAIKSSNIGLIIATTLTSESLEGYTNFLENSYNIGAERVKTQAVISQSVDGIKLNLNKDELIKVKDVSLSFMDKIGDKGYISFPCYMNLFPNENSNLDKKVCSIGKRFIINSNGEIILCELLNNLKVGNILTDNFRSIIMKGHELSIKNRTIGSGCINCDFVKNCDGGCLAMSSLAEDWCFEDKNCIYRCDVAK